MLSLLIFAVGLLQGHAVFLINSTGTVNEQEVCQCSVILPDNIFPPDRLEAIEISNQKRSISVNQEITRIQNYQATLTEYVQKLTRRMEIVEQGGISYTELDFELLRLEIREMESLVIGRKQSINGSSTLMESLFVEIHNISVMVSQLESYDKNNVLAVRREIAFLRKKLEECEKNEGAPDLPPPVSYGERRLGTSEETRKPTPPKEGEKPEAEEEEEGEIIELGELVTTTGDVDVVEEESHFTTESAHVLIGEIMVCNRDLDEIKKNINDVQQKLKNIIDVLGRI